MDLALFFKSVLDQDRAPVVLCDLEHTIIYMNPAAGERYAGQGGMGLVGTSLLDCHPPKANEMIQRVVDWFQADQKHNLIYTFRNDKENKDVYMGPCGTGTARSSAITRSTSAGTGRP